MKEKYEAPRAMTFGSDELLSVLGPSISCTAFAGSVNDQRPKGQRGASCRDLIITTIAVAALTLIALAALLVWR